MSHAPRAAGLGIVKVSILDLTENSHGVIIVIAEHSEWQGEVEEVRHRQL